MVLGQAGTDAFGDRLQSHCGWLDSLLGPCKCIIPALGSWGLGQPPGGAPYGKCVRFEFFFF